ncbi:MAG: hypothetical protein ILA17_06640 [Ruminococcus sp.]|nr:hypothetical protein [Ruminococcus sp.]
MIMNKENKTLNLAFRICLILTWVMSNISFFAMMTGFKNIETDGLNEKNIAERMLKIIGDFGSKTVFYYITFGMLAACVVLAIVTRYKTKLVSYIFRLLGLVLALMTMISGFDYIGALSSCKGLSGIAANGTSKEAVTQALTSAGFSGNASETAKMLTDKDAAGGALAAYILPIIVLFILTITTIHCLVKKKDPNNKNGGSEE